MEHRASKSIKQLTRISLAVVALGSLSLLAGCLGGDKAAVKRNVTPPPTADSPSLTSRGQAPTSTPTPNTTAAKPAPTATTAKPNAAGTAPEIMEVLWDKEVLYLRDPTKNGQQAPVLAARVLFLPNEDAGLAVPVEGTLVIEVFDETNYGDGKPPKKIEQCNIPSAALQKMLQPNPWLGICYRVGIPWTSYKNTINQIHMTARFEPATGGQPLTSTSEVIALGSTTSTIKQTTTDPRIPQAKNVSH
jgi:hypothetical protein